jgi:hypothetical protein
MASWVFREAAELYGKATGVIWVKGLFNFSSALKSEKIYTIPFKFKPK